MEGKVGLIVPVQFLERAAIELAGRHVAGHRQERHRVEKRVAERNRQVRRARPAGGEGRGRPPRDAVIDVRHEAGDAFMMHRDGLEFVGTLIQRVDELDIAVAAQAEHLRHFFLDQIIDDDLGTVERIARRHRFPPLTVRLLLQEIGALTSRRNCLGARHPISHNTVRQFILWYDSRQAHHGGR